MRWVWNSISFFSTSLANASVVGVGRSRINNGKSRWRGGARISISFYARSKRLFVFVRDPLGSVVRNICFSVRNDRIGAARGASVQNTRVTIERVLVMGLPYA